MGLFSSLKQKTVHTGQRLVGYEQMKQGFSDQASMVKGIFNYNTKKFIAQEERTYIPTEEVTQASKAFKMMVVLFDILFLFSLLYCTANLLAHHWITALLSLAFAVLCLSFAFRYHFWLYQIKRKMLGLTFKDYYRDVLKGKVKDKKTDQNSNKDM